MKKLLLILFLNIALCTFSLNFSELRGIVLDSRTLEPVKNAKVFVEDEIAFTDINGEFYVQALLSGANLVRIEKQMYEEYSKVAFLYKGHNSKKFVISHKYGEVKKKQTKISEEIIKIKETPETVEIDKSFPEVRNNSICEENKITEPESNNSDYCSDEYIYAKNNFRKDEDNSLNSIMGILNRLSGEIVVEGEVVEKNTGLPLSEIPIFFDNKVVFTSDNGKFSVKTSANSADIIIDCKGYEKYQGKFKFDKSNNFIKLNVERLGGIL